MARVVAGALILCIIIVGPVYVSSPTHHVLTQTTVKTPALISQGPYSLSSSSSGDPYWFQTGAMGYSSGLSASSNFVAASVTIRTVYDNVNYDAHSYWVGGFLSNMAFVQVGYVNVISTTNQPYCCAWFYEYFPANNPSCCEPVIGPEGSAGPIGSWHNYTMAHTGSGVWTFYMDSQPLGSSPGLGATNSGTWAPAAIAEVANTTSTTDIIGPAEFKSFSFKTTANGRLTPLQSAGTFLYYGSGTPPVRPPNPYWVVEVEGQNNDFLVGSEIPQPPNTTPTQSPGAPLWPTTPLPYQASFVFLDNDSQSFTPSWVSLRDTSGTRIYYTTYLNQGIETGSWTVDRVVWHSTDVAIPESISIPGVSTATFHTNVFSIRLRVLGIISSLPITGASILTILPDSVSTSARTDSMGETVLSQLPAAAYRFRITAPYGVPTTLSQNLTQSATLTARIFGVVDLGIIVLVPITAGLLIAVFTVRRERLRRASQAPPTYYPVVMNCARCGQPVQTGAGFCANCGAPVQNPSGLGESQP